MSASAGGAGDRLGGKVAVVATLPLQPGQRDAAMAVLRGAIEHTRAEPGTQVYLLHTDPKNDDVVVMYEVYDSRDALGAHMSADWFKAMGPELLSLLAGAPTLQILDLVDGKGL